MRAEVNNYKFNQVTTFVLLLIIPLDIAITNIREDTVKKKTSKER